MIFLVKLLTLSGVGLNFLGSLMMLDEYRDLLPLPLTRWWLRWLRRDADKLLGPAPSPSVVGFQIGPSIERSPRTGIRRSYSAKAFYRASPEGRNRMAFIMNLNRIRDAIGLPPMDVTGFNGLDRQATYASLDEVEAELNHRASDDKHVWSPRPRAVKLFILGFLALLAAAFLDLLNYALA